MLTYTPQTPKKSPSHREYPWALLLLVFAWLWPGVFSHDLWKPNETSLYAILFDSKMVWLPQLDGRADFDVAPIYIVAMKMFQAAFVPKFAEPFAAARMASVFFTALGLLGSGMAGYRFLGRWYGRSVVLILVGSVGLLPIGHFLNAQSVVFAAVGLALWGYSILTRQVVFGAALVGVAAMLLQQSLGGLAALAMLLSGSLTLLSEHERGERPILAQCVTWAVSLPLLFVYPIGLFLTRPEVFHDYIQSEIWGDFGGMGRFQVAFHFSYYLKNIIWFTFPALPLAAWTVSRGGILNTRMGVFSVSWLGIFGIFLLFNPRANQDFLILILPILALLGAAQLDNLRRGAYAFLNWFGTMTFGAAILFLWVGFAAMNYGFPAKLAQRAAYFSPYYTRDIDMMPMIVALVFTPLWLLAMTRKNIRGRQAVTNWAAGTTVVWALLMTLFLPWIDAAKSYRPLVQQIEKSLLPETKAVLKTGAECVYINPKNQDARRAWQFYADYAYSIRDTNCRYELAQYVSEPKLPERTKIVWQGRRPRNKTEWFVLIEK